MFWLSQNTLGMGSLFYFFCWLQIWCGFSFCSKEMEELILNRACEFFSTLDFSQ